MRRLFVTLFFLLLFAQRALADPTVLDGTVVARSKSALGCGYVRLKVAGAQVRDVLRVTRKGGVVGEVMVFEVDGLYAMVMPVSGKKVDLRVGDGVTFVGHREANVQNGLTQAEADRVMAGIRSRAARMPVPSSSRAGSSTWNPPDIQSSFVDFSPGQITTAVGRTGSASADGGQVVVSGAPGGTLGLSSASTDRGMASSSRAASGGSTRPSPADVKSSFTQFSPGQITDARGRTVSAGVTRDTMAIQQQFEREGPAATVVSAEPTMVSQMSAAQGAVCRLCYKEGSRGITVAAVGSFLCEACLTAPVTDPTKVEYNLYPFVTDVFERVIGWSTVGLKPNIEMEDTGEGLLGYWPVESASFTPGANHFGVIKVKRGTSALLMLGVIAHEWSHAWWNRTSGRRMGEHPCNTLLYQEGFATWAMARFYQAVGQGAYFAQKVLPSLPPTPYQAGYQLFLSGKFKP